VVKKILLILAISVLVTIYLVTNNADEINEPRIETKPSNEIIEDPSKTDRLSEPEKVSLTKYGEELDNYGLFVNCGSDRSLFTERLNLIDQSKFDSEQIIIFDDHIDQCHEWFLQLENYSEIEYKKLIQNLQKQKETLISLGTLKYNENTLDLARKEINSSDAYLSSIALQYLLRFDSDFIKEVASRMGVTDVTFLQNSYHPIGLFMCSNGEDCSETSPLMIDLCVIDEKSCNRSYEALVRELVTFNQYDDYLHAIQIINSIINSDWFEERGILNPIDP